MLEAMLSGGKTDPMATVVPSTTSPVAGTTMSFTATVVGLTDADVLYWAIADGTTLVASDFSTPSGSGRTTNKKWTVNLTMPYKSVNTNKQFKIGIGRTLAEAKAGALGISTAITMRAAPSPSGSQTWTTGGTYSLVVPEFVTYMTAYAASGGGGGGGAENKYGGKAGTPGSPGVGNGSTGFAVTPGETLTITVGAGGTAGAAGANNGGVGGTTTIRRSSNGASPFTLYGGNGGIGMGGSGGGDGGKAAPAGSGVNVSGVSVTPLPGTPGSGGNGGSVSYKAATAGAPGAVRLVW